MKRVKERYVYEVVEAVEEWRRIFNLPPQEDKQFFTLEEAAQMVGIPKKSLEDYELLLKRVKKYVKIQTILDQKFGFVRQLVKMHSRSNQENGETTCSVPQKVKKQIRKSKKKARKNKSHAQQILKLAE